MKVKAPSNDRAFVEKYLAFSSVGVERFELPISCSQKRLKILYKSYFTSVYIVEIEPFYKQKPKYVGGL